MHRWRWSVALVSLVFAGGCAMCDNSADYDYGAYGGVCDDGACGTRAGSAFAAESSMPADAEEVYYEGEGEVVDENYGTAPGELGPAGEPSVVQPMPRPAEY